MTRQSPPRRSLAIVGGFTGLALAATLLCAPTAASASPPATVEGMNIDGGGTVVLNDVDREQIAPGLVHVRYERLGTDGWQQVNVLKADLSDSTVKMKYLTPPTIAGRGATVTELVAGGGAIAGVNLDRFDINNSGAAAGWGVSGGEIIKSGNPNEAEASVGMTADGLGALVDLVLEGSVALADGTSLRLSAVNAYTTNGGVALYTSGWGTYSRTARWVNGADAGVEVTVDAEGTVLSVSDRVGDGEIAEGTQVLVTRDDWPEAERLRQLTPGDKVTVAYGIRDNGVDMLEAGGAWHRLLKDGEVVNHQGDEYLSTRNPRTMIGFSQDKRTAYFVVVDGRQAVAAGMTFPEMSKLMRELGAHDAINADGGGSSQMNVRRPGESGSSIANVPSDGFERHDGDGMGFVLAQPGSGILQGFRLDAVLDDGKSLRVFPGLTRSIAAHGFDEKHSAVGGDAASWGSDDSAVATVARDGSHGVVTGVATGETTITAGTGASTGSAELTVLGTLNRLTTDQTTLNLEAKGASAVVTLMGHDAVGFSAPVEPRDVTVVNDSPDVFSVEPTDDGRFLVTAIGEVGSETLAFEVAGARTEIALAVPLELKLIDDFSNIGSWATAHDRAPTGGIEIGEGHEGSPSIRLNYDFRESTGTRGRYAVAPGAPGNGTTGGVAIPGRPQKLSMWVKGDGRGSWLRLQVMQANGVRNWIDPPANENFVTWTGWKRVDFVVPQAYDFPLKLERIRALETVASKQYAGSLEFSKIYAYLPPADVVAPHIERAEDAVIVGAGETDDEKLRVAIVSDAQFVARNPDAYEVEGARKALREIVAQKPDMVVVNGDLVDEASPADFELAKRVLDEELSESGIPMYYVPGNHEIMGGAIGNFQAVFGDTSRTVDAEGTRIIMLNSASGKFATDFSQLKMLRTQLDAAADDPAVTGVLVVSHMPTNDPLPTKSSQLADRNEAALVDDWLQDFRAESGKSIAYIGSHVGVFHATSVDGVPYIVNGNSGKGPAGTPADGGFTGWTMLGIDPSEGLWHEADDRWLEVETKPRVDDKGLRVSAPKTLAAGEHGEISAQFTQDAGHDPRTVPVAWPVSSHWAGERVHVGDIEGAPADAIVAVDPRAGTITALRSGSATVEVTVNGQTAKTTVEVPAKLDFEVSATTRTIAGKQYVSGVVTNRDAVPVDVTISTPFGEKTLRGIAPGKSANVSFNSRAGSIDAGEVTAIVTRTVDGESVTVTKSASYAARS